MFTLVISVHTGPRGAPGEGNLTPYWGSGKASGGSVTELERHLRVCGAQAGLLVLQGPQRVGSGGGGRASGKEVLENR